MPYLQPIHTSSTGLVGRIVGRQHLDHQALASILHTLFKERLNLVGSMPVGRFGKVEFALYRVEMLLEQLTTLFER